MKKKKQKKPAAGKPLTENEIAALLEEEFSKEKQAFKNPGFFKKIAEAIIGEETPPIKETNAGIDKKKLKQMKEKAKKQLIKEEQLKERISETRKKEINELMSLIAKQKKIHGGKGLFEFLRTLLFWKKQAKGIKFTESSKQLKKNISEKEKKINELNAKEEEKKLKQKKIAEHILELRQAIRSTKKEKAPYVNKTESRTAKKKTPKAVDAVQLQGEKIAVKEKPPLVLPKPSVFSVKKKQRKAKKNKPAKPAKKPVKSKAVKKKEKKTVKKEVKAKKPVLKPKKTLVEKAPPNQAPVAEPKKVEGIEGGKAVKAVERIGKLMEKGREIKVVESREEIREPQRVLGEKEELKEKIRHLNKAYFTRQIKEENYRLRLYDLNEKLHLVEVKEKKGLEPVVARQARPLAANKGKKFDKILEEKARGRFSDEKLKEMQEKIKATTEKYGVPGKQMQQDLEHLDARKLLQDFDKLVGLVESGKKESKVIREKPSEIFGDIPIGKIRKTKPKLTIEKEIEQPKIETDFDRLLSLIRKKGSVKLSEVKKELRIPSAKLKEAYEILEENGLLEIKYPVIGEVSLVFKGSPLEEEISKMKQKKVGSKKVKKK